jgi:hypothetical protein
LRNQIGDWIIESKHEDNVLAPMMEHGGHNEHFENVQQDDNALQGGEG